MSSYVYILKCKDNRYYVGVSNNIKKRLEEHNAGKNKFTKSRRPVQLIYSETFNSKGEAMTREKQIKSWKDRQSIEQLIMPPSSNG